MPEGKSLKSIEVGEKYEGVKVSRRQLDENDSDEYTDEEDAGAMDEMYNAAVKTSTRNGAGPMDAYSSSSEDEDEDEDTDASEDGGSIEDQMARIRKKDVSVLLGSVAARQEKERAKAREQPRERSDKLWGG